MGKLQAWEGSGGIVKADIEREGTVAAHGECVEAPRGIPILAVLDILSVDNPPVPENNIDGIR